MRSVVKNFGWPYQQYYTHESGLKAVPLEKCVRYAQAFDVDPAWLILGDMRHPPDWIEHHQQLLTTVPVIGTVAAGQWIDGVRLEGETAVFNGKLPPNSVAYRVSGDSMDQFVGDGGLAFAKPTTDNTCASGQVVVVERICDDGRYEYTLKQCQQGSDGNIYLLPRSSNPIHTPIHLGPSMGSQIRIVAQVVAFQAPLSPSLQSEL